MMIRARKFSMAETKNSSFDIIFAVTFNNTSASKVINVKKRIFL